MSEVRILRDHCREMSTGAHCSDCNVPKKPYRAAYQLPAAEAGMSVYRSCPDEVTHGRHEHYELGLRWDCPGLCLGCAKESEVEMWTRLADEIDAYLADDTAEDEGLFG